MPTAQTAGVLIVKLLGDASGYQKMLAGAQARLKAFGTTMSMYVTAPLAIMGGMAVREFGKFDKAMAESLSIMKTTTEQELRMRKQALDLASKSTKGPDEIARSYFYLASAGLNAEQAMKVMPVLLKFATAGAFDLARATELLMDAQSALGLKVADTNQNMINAARVGDVLVRANVLANGSVEQFATALTSKAGSAMKVFKVSVEEGVAVLAAMADQGIKAELAGNNFARVLFLMSKASMDNQAAFKKFGFTMYQASGALRPLADIVQNLEQILEPMSAKMKSATLEALGFEARVQGAISPLIGTSAAIRKYYDELKKAGGYMQEVSDKQMKSFSKQLQVLWNQIKVLSIGIGEGLAPKILQLGGYVKDMILVWNGFSEGTKTAVTYVALFAAAIGPLAIGISVLIKFVSMLGVAVAALFAGTPAAVLIFAGILTVGFVELEKWLYRLASGAEEFEAKMTQAAKRGAQELAKLSKSREATLTELNAMPRGPKKDVAVASKMTTARDNLGYRNKELQYYARRLQEESTWFNTYFNRQILQKADAEYEEAKLKYDKTLEYYNQLAGIKPGETAADNEAAMIELDKMEATQASIDEYIASLNKIAATVGMNESQVKLWEFAHDGATQSMLAEARSVIELTASIERHQKALETGKAMIEEYLTPLEKLEKRRKEIAGLFLVGAIGNKTAERASLAANKEYKEAEKALRELQMKANIRINFDFTNNKAVREGTDEFYALMQLVPNAGELPTPKDKGGAVGPGGGGGAAGALNYEQLRELEDANFKLANIARNTARPPVIIEVASAGLQ